MRFLPLRSPNGPRNAAHAKTDGPTSMNIQAATKDCRVCHRRRIKCDRSLPSCNKCAKKNIHCPGYGLSLKWDQGVASRGRLAGRNIPLPPETGLLPTESHIQSTLNIDQISTALTHVPLLPFTQCFSFSPLEGHNARFLLHHYNHVVAPNMAWADSLENPWRDVIIPMAMESPLVLLSILTFAAKHLSTMAQSALLDKESRKAAICSRIYGNHALKLLAQELRPLTSEDRNGVSPSLMDIQARRRHNTLLAAMLVLCNVETVRPDTSIWRVHLNASRTVIASGDKEIAVRDSVDTTTSILRQELSIASTFASLTSFSLPNNDDYSTREPGGPFAEFLKLLHMVTRLERQAFQDPDSVYCFGISSDGFQQLFEHARARTLQLSTTLKFSLPDGRLQFNRIVNSFYHAGLIYAYRALFNHSSTEPSSVESKITTSVIGLFQTLEPMEMDKQVYAQDLVWPLFIAGTEALSLGEQEMVVHKLEQAMRGTGFSNCEHALEFLRAFWAERARVVQDVERGDPGAALCPSWIPFARGWEEKGHVFLVF